MERTQRGPERLSGGQTFHSPRGSWCREPLWFCKLWVEGGEREAERSQQGHPPTEPSPAGTGGGGTQNSCGLQGKGRWGRGHMLTQQWPAPHPGELDPLPQCVGERDPRPCPPRQPRPLSTRPLPHTV